MKLINLIFLVLCAIFFGSTISAKEGIRGVWVPAPHFTDVLWTHDNVIKFVDNLDDLNMNAIFLVSYADNKVIYNSKVLMKNTTYTNIEQTNILKSFTKEYKSTTNDPVRDLIDEAHKRDIKVIFWFEYGFMGSGKPISKEDPILAKHPNWIGVGNDKEPANYNKSDYYFNAYNPEVQDYLIELIKESIALYPDVDGVQGDDRLPAMPINSGYDEYTKKLYKKEFKKLPPKDFRDGSWVRWRLDILNNFGVRLHKEIKKSKKNILVSFAPNPYPWCKDNLMQEWPEWCKQGICDILAVQCYRYNEEAYYGTVKSVVDILAKNNPKQHFYPGIILTLGTSSSGMTPDILRKQININRELGIEGEIYFYNKGINIPEFRSVLKDMYNEKITFPKF